MCKKSYITTIFICLSLCLYSCGGPSRTVKITDKFEPLYRPTYNYVPAVNVGSPGGYTIGIIQPEFIQKNPKGFKWDLSDQKDQLAINDLKREVANTIEKILLSKGCKVVGPFASYEEMTFPERERCSFLIQPTILLDLNGQVVSGSRRELSEVGGPNLEAYCYSSIELTVNGNIDMEYVILDSLTKEKLERHKLKSALINKPAQLLLQGTVDKHNNCGEWKTLDQFVKVMPSFRGVYTAHNNLTNVGNHILEELYSSFMPQVAQLLSVEEFNHLKKYKDQLKEKKVY